jgi:RimJ/RimL family protein N-acetyltransferase
VGDSLAQNDMTVDSNDQPAARVPYRIETERLVVRCYDPEDAEALLVRCAENREHLLPWLIWAEAEPQTLDEKLELILGFRSRYDSGENSVMGIFEKASGELVGGTGLHPCEGLKLSNTREIGYWICADREGRGYVTEAVEALLVVAFRWLRVATVVVRCEPDNLRSRTIPERLGFTCEGLLRGTHLRANGDPAPAYRYCMTDAEFEESELATEWRKDPGRVVAFDALGRRVSIR